MLACKELRELVFVKQKNNASSTTNNEVSQVKEEAGEPSSKAEQTEKPTQLDTERVERLMLRVASLKKMNTGLIEELFFNDVIQNVQIDSLIPSIIGSDVDSSSAFSSNAD